MTREKLIEKLKRATEGSRELDLAICEVTRAGCSEPETCPNLCAEFSRSLDAALTLAPKIWQGLYLTWEWTGSKRESGEHKRIAFLRRGIHSYVTAEGKGASLPLALCIAVLRALQYEDDQRVRAP